MKRFIALIMTILCVSSMAVAEEKEVFSIRNGIRFGMTIEEVQKHEKAPVKRSDENSRWIDYSPVTIVDIDNCLVEYKFSDSNRLNSVFMNLCNDRANYITVSSQYDTLNRALIEKYGAPLVLGKGESSIYASPHLNQVVKFLSLYDNYKYDEWVFVSDDESSVIVIDHIYTHMKGNKKNNSSVTHEVCYNCIELNQHSDDI